MPIAHGGDRVTELSDGSFVINSPYPKHWKPRRAATLTSAEFPGTAVTWDGEVWEVVEVSESTSTGISVYSLVPWRDDQAIRISETYDDASERLRKSEHDKAVKHQRRAQHLVLAGLVLGHLPSHTQKEIESEYGFIAKQMTLISTLPMMLLAAYAATGLPIVNQNVDYDPGRLLPPWFILLGAYAFLDSFYRIRVYLMRGAPSGSLIGLIAWEVIKLGSQRARELDRRASRGAETRLSVQSATPPSDYHRERDAYAMREPYVALLSPEEQRRLAEVFGFDPISWGRRTAIAVTVVAMLGLVTSVSAIAGGEPSAGRYASVLVAGALLAEQVSRFRSFNRGEPAGSVLGALVRPWCRSLLMIQPRALKQGSILEEKAALPDVWEDDEPPDDQPGR